MKSKRVVIKVGTSVLTRSSVSDKTSHFEIKPNSALGSLIAEIADLHGQEIEVLLVTSGAIGAGVKQLHWSVRPAEIRKKQAAAAIGQVSLMQSYQHLFNSRGVQVAQVLLTRTDFEDRKRYLNVRNTLLTLLELGVVPVINENDTVAVEEIQFGDNDRLSALVAAKMDADLLVILTDVEGLLDKDKELVTLIPKITPEVEALAWKGVKSETGTGGMSSKIEAAKITTASGVTTIIANAYRPGVLTDIAAGREVGTKFLSVKSLKSKEKWILFGAVPKGELIVDAGAEKALKELGKSLLPAGIVSLQGSFQKGDVVRIKSAENGEIARGVVTFSSAEIEKIKGRKTSELADILKIKSNATEVVHRDAMVIL